MGAGASVERVVSEALHDMARKIIAEAALTNDDRLGDLSPAKPPTTKSASYKGGSGGFNSSHSLRSTKSLRSMALKANSRHENSYITPLEVMNSSSLFIGSKIKSRDSNKLTMTSSKNSLSSNSSNNSLNKKTPPSSTNVSFNAIVIVDENATTSATGANRSGGKLVAVAETRKMGGRPNLKINIQDDADWIQVSDDEGGNGFGDDDNKNQNHQHSHQAQQQHAVQRPPRDSLSQNRHHAQQSYMFTQSGTIFVDGFNEGIGIKGIQVNNNNKNDNDNVNFAVNNDAALKMPLNDRLVVLCRLGAGASGVVYKAFDLVDLRLVALKMIPMFERVKRKQMVRELATLFQMLRKKKEEIVAAVQLEIATADSSSSSSTAVPPTVPETNKKTTTNRRNNRRRKRGDIENDVENDDKKLPHEFIVDFYDAFSNVEEGGVALMMEYMDGGSLQDIVNDGGCDDEGILANIAAQGLEGLAFLHSCNQLHRDLKPGNFLISKLGDVKVADLGILRQMDLATATASTIQSNNNDSGGPTIQRASTFVGTATYMSPERIDAREYSFPSDIWSFGLTLLTVALGRLPIDTQGGYWTILQRYY